MVTRWISCRVGLTAITVAVAAWLPAPAFAGWRLTGTRVTSIAYNQGIAFDQAQDSFFLDGVSSTTNSGLYRTSPGLSLQAARFAVLPPTPEGYNHAGDLTVGPGAGPGSADRVLLPLECYYPSAGGNTCGTGALGVADPRTLRLRYYVDLDRSQIQKAMWAEVSPDGNWIWTSSGADLLAYRSSDVNPATAARQRAGTAGGIMGVDLGPVLPSSEVTGAAFSAGPSPGTARLFLSLNLGTTFEVVSYVTGTGAGGTPTLVSPTPQTEITVPQSFSNHEPEGLAVTAPGVSPALGGVLHWQMLPALPLWSSILNYTPGP